MDNYAAFKDKLDKAHAWPSMYMFKFIVPKGKEQQVSDILLNQNISTKSSSSGNYISVTSKVIIKSSDEVIEIYKEAQKIEGVIAL